MRGSRTIVLVAEREVRERLRGRAFRASTLMMLLAVVGIVVFAALRGDDGPTGATLAVSGTQPAAVARAAVARQEAFDLRLETRPEPSPRAARRAVLDGDVDAALSPGGAIAVGPDAPAELVPLLRTAWRDTLAHDALRTHGLGPDEIRAVLSPSLQVARLGDDDDEGAAALAYVGTLLLYVGILTFGYYVASGVVEEKSTRVIELVLSAVRPAHLLAGKVIGIGLLGLAQLAAIAGIGIAVALALGRFDLPSATPDAVLVGAVFFVLGYAFYACGFAAAGAIVSRQEDIQSTTAPLAVALVVSYLAALPVAGDPDSTLARVTTYLPPVAPLTVPARAAQDAIAPWQLALSVVVMVAGTVLLLLLAARIYERTILHLGAPLKLTQALRVARGRQPDAGLSQQPQ